MSAHYVYFYHLSAALSVQGFRWRGGGSPHWRLCFGTAKTRWHRTLTAAIIEAENLWHEDMPFEIATRLMALRQDGCAGLPGWREKLHYAL